MAFGHSGQAHSSHAAISYCCLQHRERFFAQVERQAPFLPVGNALSSLGCVQDREALLHFFTVAKRIALFLARTSPQQTIDHLVYEISQQISEPDDAPAASDSPTGVGCLPAQFPPPCCCHR